MKNDDGVVRATPQNITKFVNPGSPLPKPEEIFMLSQNIIRCIRDITPKIQKTGAWWAIGGDLSEMMGGVGIQATHVEILTSKEGVQKISEALAEYGPTPITTVETKLDRDAEIEGKKYPVRVRSQRMDLKVHGAEVQVHGDYQMKVGEWEWGDPLEFKAPIVNIVGTRVPVMPIRLSSELYLTLGWSDRVDKISQAIAHAHHGRGQYGDETRSNAYDAQVS